MLPGVYRFPVPGGLCSRQDVNHAIIVSSRRRRAGDVVGTSGAGVRPIGHRIDGQYALSKLPHVYSGVIMVASGDRLCPT